MLGRLPCSALPETTLVSHRPSASVYGLRSCPLLSAGWSSTWQIIHGCLTQQVKKSQQVSSYQVVSQQPPFVVGAAPLRHPSGKGTFQPPDLRQASLKWRLIWAKPQGRGGLFFLFQGVYHSHLIFKWLLDLEESQRLLASFSPALKFKSALPATRYCKAVLLSPPT